MCSDFDKVNINRFEDEELEEGELGDDGVAMEISNTETADPEEMPRLSNKRHASYDKDENSNCYKKKRTKGKEREKKRRSKRQHRPKHNSQESHPATTPPPPQVHGESRAKKSKDMGEDDNDDFTKGLSQCQMNKKSDGGGPGMQSSGGDNYQEGSGRNNCDQSLGNQSLGEIDGSSNRAAPNQSALTVPEFLPPTQRKLFIRIQKKQQQEEKKAILLAEKEERDKEGDSANWYSSEDEDDAGSVMSILKTLQQHSKTNRPPKPEWASSHLRLQKAQATLTTSTPANSRVVHDPCLSLNTASSHCLQNNPSSPPASSSSSLVDTYLNRQATLKPSPRVMCSSPPMHPSFTEEEEEEWVPRNNTVPIPLEPLINTALHDPRSQLQQFSHIKRDLVLKKPAFAKKVLWSPEDLIEIPIPWQTFLTLATRHQTVASRDPRLTSIQQQLHLAIPTSPHSSSGLYQGVLPTASQMFVPSEKPTDPRMSRNIIRDTQLQQKSSFKPPSVPSTHKVSDLTTSPALPMPTLSVPFNSRVLSVGGVGQREGGGSSEDAGSRILSSTSLHGPQKQMADKLECPEATTSHSKKRPRNSTGASTKRKAKEPLFVHKSPLDQPELQKSSGEPTNRYNSYNRHRPKSSSNLAAHGGAHANGGPLQAGQGPVELQATVHNLPVSSVFCMEKQATFTTDLFGGSSSAQPDPTELDEASLKDVFNGFDPTASPFCL